MKTIPRDALPKSKFIISEVRRRQSNTPLDAEAIAERSIHAS